MIRANGRSALIFGAWLLVGFAGPSYAASDDLNSPTFVAPSNSGAQPSTTAQPTTENQAIAPDQSNEADQSQHENTTHPNTPAATTEAPAARSVPVMAASGEHSVWDETSVIGKIFIGLGALLTIASAARMFMA